MEMTKDIEKIILTAEEIDKNNERLGKEISRDYEGKNPLFFGLLKGCNPFMTDLLKHVDIYCTVEYIKASSYFGSSSSGVVLLKGDLPDVEGRDIIIVDDIIDTGRTLYEVKRVLLEHKAKSVKICVLMDKPEGRVVDIDADYVGGIVPKEFVVGYGLDYNEHYRNLPYIAVLKEEVYKK